MWGPPSIILLVGLCICCFQCRASVTVPWKCEVGRFGPDCENECFCAGNVSCHPLNGSCPDDKCAPGYFGSSCHVVNAVGGKDVTFWGPQETTYHSDDFTKDERTTVDGDPNSCCGVWRVQTPMRDTVAGENAPYFSADVGKNFTLGKIKILLRRKNSSPMFFHDFEVYTTNTEHLLENATKCELNNEWVKDHSFPEVTVECKNPLRGRYIQIYDKPTSTDYTVICEVLVIPEGYTCPDGFYGAFCEHQCLCKENKCDEETHECLGETPCKDGLFGDDCLTVLPKVAENPQVDIVDESSETSLKVTWPEWTEEQGYGEGSVRAYKVTARGSTNGQMPLDIQGPRRVMGYEHCDINQKCSTMFENAKHGMTYIVEVIPLYAAKNGFVTTNIPGVPVYSSPMVVGTIVAAAPPQPGPAAETKASGLGGGLIAFVAILVLILLALPIIGAVLHVRNKSEGGLPGVLRRFRGRRQPFDPITMEENLLYGGNCDPDDLEGRVITEPVYVNAEQLKHKPIKVAQLHDYITLKRRSEPIPFQHEYLQLPVGLRAKAQTAVEQDNIMKNRYRNIIAYDHTRVVLDTDTAQGHTSDYINANYVDGCEGPGCYIAVQGPIKASLDDMWRMAWQEHATTIVMVTNLVERGRLKCEQYWPDDGQQRDYMGIRVKHISMEKYVHYVIRTFTMTKEREEVREVKQFHFTAWPDHGVPVHATALLAFRNKIRAYWLASKSPLITHCSAGVGRTGTYMAIDTLIEQGKKEGQIDVFNYVQLMRTQRVNMIQTVDQYVFVHDALVEAFMFEKTCMALSSLSDRVKTLMRSAPDDGKSPLSDQFMMLEKTKPVLDVENDCMVASSNDNHDNNRDSCILPPDKARAILQTPAQGHTDYINAVCVDSFSQFSGLLVTQTPMPDTVVDLWRLVYDFKASAIVVMQPDDEKDQTCAQYWPDDYTPTPYGPFTVELISTCNHLQFGSRDFSITLTNRGQRVQKVRQFEVYSGCVRPAVVMEMVKQARAWLAERQVEQEALTPGPVVVHCGNGNEGSGLFCGAHFISEQAESEQEVDVCQAVQIIRTNRPTFFTDLEQFRFLHRCALCLVESESEADESEA